jgi:hypothetical protein
MRIEPVEHAVDRLLDQLRIIRLLDIVGADAFEQVAEQVELAVGVGSRRFRAQHQPRLGDQKRGGHAGGRAQEDQ